ncbi:MAG: thioredoxin domain-containing protein [Patescibacteria group bacterium]
MKQLVIYIGVIVLIAGGIFGLSKLDNASQKSSPVLPAVLSAKDVAIGNKQAKVIIIEYSDFQCPACASYNDMVNQLLKDYDEKILVVYRFFPLRQHKNAFLASQAAYAASLQGKFKEMKDQLFEHQNDWTEEDNARDIFIEYAKTIGLDSDKFQKDMDSNETKKIISDSENSALSLGINSTPTFFINDTQQIFGTYEELKQLIDKSLQY